VEKLDITDLEISPLTADWLTGLLGPMALVPFASQREPAGEDTSVELRHQTRWSLRPDPNAPAWSAEETYYCTLGCQVTEIKRCLEPRGERCK
jgi:hypothetical protein